MPELNIPLRYEINQYVRFPLLVGIGEGKIWDIHRIEVGKDGKWDITYVVYSPTGVDHLVGEDDIL